MPIDPDSLRDLVLHDQDFDLDEAGVDSSLSGNESFREFLGAATSGVNWFDSSAGGVLGPTGGLLQVAQSGSDISVNYGGAVIPVSGSASFARWFFVRDAAGTITDLFTPADPTDPRIDAVIVEITDLATGAGAVVVVTGTPAPDPEGPDIPANAIRLADVTIPAGEDDPANWVIEDLRQPAVIGKFDGGVVEDAVIFKGYVNVGQTGGDEAELFVGALAIASQFAVRTGLNGDTILGANGSGDTPADDVIFMFGGAGLARSARPTIDPTAATAEQLCNLLIALGLVIDGS